MNTDTFRLSFRNNQTQPLAMETIPKNISTNYGLNESSNFQDSSNNVNLYEHYVCVNSGNRNSTNYPLHYNYRINFNEVYKNVKKIELIKSVIPNQGATVSSGDILNEPFLLIDIEEINYIQVPSSGKTLEGFAVIPLAIPNKSTGGFINLDLGTSYQTSKVYKEPIASLTSITIKIKDLNGDLYDFGQPSGSTAKQFQNTFVFKITTQEFVRKESSRIVF